MMGLAGLEFTSATGKKFSDADGTRSCAVMRPKASA
jgi:hypothetical protein